MGRFFVWLLGLANVLGAWALVGLFGFEGDLIAFAKISESNLDEAGGVEKYILVAAIWSDKAKSLFAVDTLDNSCHMFTLKYLIPQIRRLCGNFDGSPTRV